MPAPTDLAAVPVDVGIRLLWTDNTLDESGFLLERRDDDGDWETIASTARDESSYVDASTHANQLYSFRVRAYRGDERSNYSNMVQIRTELAPPGAPTQLSATAESATRVSLSWTDTASTENAFLIQRSLQPEAGWQDLATVEANTTAYTDATGVPTTTYYYRVAADSVPGRSSFSELASATTFAEEPALDPPGAPTALQATATGAHSVRVDWQQGTGEERGVHVEVATANTGPWSTAGSTGANIVTLAIDGLEPATLYFFRARAYNGAGNSAYSALTTITTLAQPPAAPTGLTALAKSESEIALAWRDQAVDETGFAVEVAASSTGPWVEHAELGINVEAYTVVDLDAATAYFFRVRALGVSEHSEYSNISSASTDAAVDGGAPDPPTNLQATIVDCGAVTLTWAVAQDPEGSPITGYRIFRDDVFIAEATTTSYVDRGVAAGAVVSHAITAVDGAGNESNRSDAVMTTVPPCTSGDGEMLWGYSFGSEADDRAEAVALGPDGSIAVTGYFAGTLDFGGDCAAISAAAEFDALVAKFSAEGQCEWATRFGGDSNYDRGQGVAFDSVGDVLVTGYFEGTVDFGARMLTGQGIDGFVAKLAGDNGTTRWVEPISTAGVDLGLDVDVADDDSVVVAASTFAAMKFASNGNLLWSVPLSSNQRAFGIAVDGNGHVYSTGRFGSSMTSGNDTLEPQGQFDGFLLSYDAQGQPRWARQVGGSDFDEALGVAANARGDVVVVGYFDNSASVLAGGVVQASLASAGQRDLFVAKFNAAGDLSWAQSHGAAINDYARAVDVDTAGNVFVSGEFRERIDFGDGFHEGDRTNGQHYVLKLASSGQTLWSQDFVDSGANFGYGIAADGIGGAVTTGYFVCFVRLREDPSQPPARARSNGSFDILLARFGP